MTQFKINVTSDTVCPWCYVGRKQLQTAERLWKQSHPDDTFAVSYLPYQLQPQWPKGPSSSTPKQQFYLEKFGAERTAMIHARLTEIGKSVGISFKYGGNTGNSRDSHRLVRLAKKYGHEVEGKALDGLFAAYFEKEGDITDYATLKSIAVEAGIPEDEFQKAIVDSDAGGADVDRDAAKARQNGVSGVPDFVIQDLYQLHGANEPESFLNVFQRIKAKEEGQ
ncbi:Fc.00g074430.m01.CDS01 [Cosmosporella sp. VM-42]